MCCTTSTGRLKSLGSPASSAWIASGPPVDAPMATMFTPHGAASNPWRAAPACEELSRARRRRTNFTSDISLSVRTSSATLAWCARSPRPAGRGTTASAPASSALKVVATWSSIMPLTTTIGTGFSCITRRVASSPSMRAMWMSMVTTSGRNSRTAASTSSPSLTAPATSRCGSPLKAFNRNSRMTGESSTISTRMRRALTTASAALRTGVSDRNPASRYRRSRRRQRRARGPRANRAQSPARPAIRRAAGRHGCAR